MSILEHILSILKGKKDADRTEKCLSRGDRRECRNIYKVNAVIERAISDFSGIRVLAAACADERGRNSRSMSADPICEESRILIAAARRVGVFVEEDKVPGTRYSIRTGESEVRFVQVEQVYYKLKNPFAKSHLKKHPIEYALYEHIIHNILFPECPLEFLGITQILNEARLIYRQKAVRSSNRPDDKSISNFLLELGLLATGRYSFGNDYLFVTDVGQDSDNVLVDENGDLFFVDPIIGFRESLYSRLNSSQTIENIKTMVYDILGVTESKR